MASSSTLPAMQITDATLYLPISERMLREVLDDSEALENVVSGLAVPQLAALVTLQYLPKLSQERSPLPERFLAQVIEAANAQLKRTGLATVTADLLPKLSRKEIREGYRLLPDFGISLLDEEDVAHRSYLTAEGSWDYRFGERNAARLRDHLTSVQAPTGEKRILTLEQSRIFGEIKAQLDEPMHVQGYAGTGKSSLVRSLLGMLDSEPNQVLVLTERKQQADALRAGMPPMERVTYLSFGELANKLIPKGKSAGSYRRIARGTYSRATLPDDDLIRHLGIKASGRFRERTIAGAVRRTVANFCRSGDDEITRRHLPSWITYWLDETINQAVLCHAAELWQAVLSPPSQEFKPTVYVYHRIKWAALNRSQIPELYTHVLIDECHDLKKPMLQIIDCSPQAVISLGDEYQNLQGRPQQRASIIRQREATHSVRSGHLIEHIVNPMIAAHPGKTKAPFHGNPLHKVEIEYYDGHRVPDRPAVILTYDEWALFGWAQRLAHAGISFELLGDKTSLKAFFNDCIELCIHHKDQRPGMLSRFASWDDVAREYENNIGFRHVDRMLRNGYRYENLQEMWSRVVGHSPGGYSLARIEDVRNREFDTVMVTPELMDLAWNAKEKKFAAIVSAVYVAVTRARQRLIAPEALRDWIEEISAAQATHARQSA